MPEFRSEQFAEIAANSDFDVIVIGGGINGIGTYRDLSLQGLRVLLVEMNDFCSGCSAAPSRMIHGGLRYLENGEFDLVRESLHERDALLRNAPHMVRPLKTTVPIRSVISGLMNGAANFFRLPSKPTERGALTIKLGLMLYDWVIRRDRLLPKHEFELSSNTLKRWPGFRKDVRFAATYHDAWISHPERLGIELIADTFADNPHSIVLNYAQISKSTDNSFKLLDVESGETYFVSAKAIVNATGAWVDSSSAELSAVPASTNPMVEGTKGSHLIVDSPELLAELNGHMVYYENSDGRVCIVFPYLGKVLVGSTDIRVTKPGRTKCEPDEQEYILQSLKYVFPQIDIQSESIVFSYSGIRPLPKSEQRFTGRISRGHSIKKIEGSVPQFCMIGGKWTTFRAFAEQVSDAVLDELGIVRRTSTTDKPIGGGRSFPTDASAWLSQLCSTFDITPERAAHLIELYGSRAEKVQSACKGAYDDALISKTAFYTEREIIYLIEQEKVVRLSDIFLRRTSLAISGEVSLKSIQRVASIAAKQLGWKPARTKQEIDTLTEELDTFHGVSMTSLNSRDK